MSLGTNGLHKDANFTPCGWTYKHIAGAATTLVKTGAGILHTITFNTRVAAGVTTVEDALTDTTPVIAIITNAATLLTDAPITVTYDVYFSIGLTVKTSQADDLTIAFI